MSPEGVLGPLVVFLQRDQDVADLAGALLCVLRRDHSAAVALFAEALDALAAVVDLEEADRRRRALDVVRERGEPVVVLNVPAVRVSVIYRKRRGSCLSARHTGQSAST